MKEQLITFFISVAFALLGTLNYMIADEPYLPLFIVSFIALLVTVGIDLINRFYEELSAEFDGIINKDVLKELDNLEEVLRDK